MIGDAGWGWWIVAGSGWRFRRQEAGGPEQPLGDGACEADPARRSWQQEAGGGWPDLGCCAAVSAADPVRQACGAPR